MATLTVSTRRIMATRIMVGRITVTRSVCVNMGIMQLGTNGVRVSHNHRLKLKSHIYIVYTGMTPLSTDVDECRYGRNRCDDYAYCTNTDGSYKCTCKYGYYGDGYKCTKKPYYYGEQTKDCQYFVALLLTSALFFNY